MATRNFAKPMNIPTICLLNQNGFGINFEKNTVGESSGIQKTEKKGSPRFLDGMRVYSPVTGSFPTRYGSVMVWAQSEFVVRKHQ